MEWIGAALTGGCAAAGIKLIENLLVWRLNRKAKLNDDEKLKNEIDLMEMLQTIQTLKIAQKVVLHDRVKYLCRVVIQEGKVSFDDREDLVEMHQIYHNDLEGNGHLDYLMKEVMKLPLK